MLSEKLENLGAEAWEYPTIKIKEPDDLTALDKAVANAGMYNWIIFTSVNGVKAFFQRLRAQKLDIRSLKEAKICAIGPKTAEALEERGLLVDVMPEVFRAEAVLEALQGRIQSGDKILLPRADLARQVLVDSLKKLGAQVDEVVAYQTVLADATDTQLLLEKLRVGEIHVLTFTSSSTVTNFSAVIRGTPSVIARHYSGLYWADYSRNREKRTAYLLTFVPSNIPLMA